MPLAAADAAVTATVNGPVDVISYKPLLQRLLTNSPPLDLIA